MRWRQSRPKNEPLNEHRLAQLVKALPDAEPPEGMTNRVLQAIEEQHDAQAAPGLDVAAEDRATGGLTPSEAGWRWALVAAAAFLFVTLPLTIAAFVGFDAARAGFEAIALVFRPLWATLSPLWNGAGVLPVLWSAGSDLAGVVAVLTRSLVKVAASVAETRLDLLLFGWGATLGLLAAFVKLLERSTPRQRS